MKHYMNKTWIYFCAFILLLSVFTACKEDDPDPEDEVDEMTLDFTFANEENSLTVVFTNASEHAVSYAWDFGDGSDVATEENPSHTYAEPGTYTVELTGTDAAGEELSVSKEVTVEQETSPELVVDFTYTNEQNSLTVDFTNASENAVSYSWDFGDGSDAVTEENPSYTYAEPGTYTVALTATDADGNEETDTEEITVSVSTTTEPGDMYDSFSGVDGESNIEWSAETAITLEHGIDFMEEKVGKYTRSASEGSQYDKIYIRPFPEDVVWTERTVLSIDVYFPSTNTYSEDRSTGITKQVELRFRKDREDGSGSDPNSEIRLIKDVPSLDEWVTLEFDMSEAAHFSGDPSFDANATYTTLVIMLGRDGGQFEGEFYLKNFNRL